MKFIGRVSHRAVVVTSGVLLAAVVLVGLVPWRLVAAEPKQETRGAHTATNAAEVINTARTATWKVTITVPQPSDEPEIIRETWMFMTPYKQRMESLQINAEVSIRILDGQKGRTIDLSPQLKCAIITDHENFSSPMRPSFLAWLETNRGA